MQTQQKSFSHIGMNTFSSFPGGGQHVSPQELIFYPMTANTEPDLMVKILPPSVPKQSAYV